VKRSLASDFPASGKVLLGARARAFVAVGLHDGPSVGLIILSPKVLRKRPKKTLAICPRYPHLQFITGIARRPVAERHDRAPAYWREIRPWLRPIPRTLLAK
jgi:hypothetical protein